MKVLLFTDSDAFAGTERHMLHLANGLRAEGVDVLLGCPDHGHLATRAREAGFQVCPIAKRGAIDLPAIAVLLRLLRATGIDIVHSHNGRTALLAALAVRMNKRSRCVATHHFVRPAHLDRPGVAGSASRLLHGWVIRNTHRHITVSDAAKEALCGCLGLGQNDIAVVPHGIAVDEALLADPAAIRRDLGVPQDDVLVVCVSRLEPEKDIPCLLEAMRFPRQTHPHLSCVVGGTGRLEAELQDQAAALGLGASVRFLGHVEDALSLIGAGDIFVLPSRMESFGLVVIEAMSLGKPVIATRSGGPVGIVLDRSSGFVVDVGDTVGLGEAIVKLAKDPGLRSQMGACGRRLYEQHYTVQRMARETLAAYHQALGRAQ